ASALVATSIVGDEIPNVQDEIPALAIAAAFADGVTEVRDAAELALKESNRIGALHQELSELGLAVEARTDGLVIRGGVRARRRSRATATTASRWRPRSRATRSTARAPCGVGRRCRRRIPSSPTTSRGSRVRRDRAAP